MPPTSPPRSAPGRPRFAPTDLVPNVVAGGVVGTMSVAISISLGALVFSGPLAAFGANGIGLALISTALVGLCVALFATLPGTVGDAQDTPAAVMAVAAAGIATAMPAGSEPGAAFVTVVATLGLTTMATGALLLAVGWLRLGRLVRYLPYPVVGGFLAGTGWLLVTGGLSILAGIPLGPSFLLDFLDAGAVDRWLPGVGFALILLVVTSRVRHYLVWPALLVGGVVAFYAAMAALGGTPAQWRAAGMMLGPFPDVDLLRPLAGADLRLVHWPLVVAQGATAASVAFLTLMSVLLNSTGLELAAGRKIDLDRELRVSGAGNLLSGAVGGMVGFQVLSFTMLNRKVGTGNRSSALVALAIVVGALVFGASLIAYVPTLIVGGLILYLGATFLMEWLYDTYFELPKLEYAVIVLIVVVIGAVGFLEGVAAGLAFAVLLFVVNYARAEGVTNALTGAHVQSRVNRDPHERRVLRAHAADLLVLQLRGFLFFGTAHGLQQQVESAVAASPAPRRVVLDFTRVTGLDATATASFVALARLAEAEGFTLVFCGVGRAVARALDGKVERAPGRDGARSFPTLDDALEWCEARILAAEATGPEVSASFEDKMNALMGEGESFADLLPYLDTEEVPAGHVLMRQGDAPDVLFFLASGRVTARLESPADSAVRLETMHGGSLVGELGFYTGGVRTASVVADAPSTVHRLTREGLDRLSVEDPAKAAALHALVVRMLAARVVHLMTVVRALQR